MSRLAVKLVGTICVGLYGKLFDKTAFFVLCEKTKNFVKILVKGQV